MRLGWRGGGIRRIRPQSSAPAAAIGAVEDVEADLLHLLHRARPARLHIRRVVVRGRANFRQEDLAGGNGHADFLRHLVVTAVGNLQLAALAGEGELAAVAPVLVLIDDAADRVRVGRIADAVENHLRHGGLALHVFAARFEVDSFGEALLLLLGEDLRRQRILHPLVAALPYRRTIPPSIGALFSLQDAREGRGLRIVRLRRRIGGGQNIRLVVVDEVGKERRNARIDLFVLADMEGAGDLDFLARDLGYNEGHLDLRLLSWRQEQAGAFEDRPGVEEFWWRDRRDMNDTRALFLTVDPVLVGRVGNFRLAAKGDLADAGGIEAGA